MPSTVKKILWLFNCEDLHTLNNEPNHPSYHQCGGVLINRQHVVTAGHCIKNKRIEDLNVTLGEYNIGESLADGEIFPSQTYKVQAMVVHPKFQFSPAADRSVKGWLNDVASYFVQV